MFEVCKRFIRSPSPITFFILFQGKNDFQTEADRAGQRCIMASLHKQFPKISMYGEEVGVKVSAADLFISFHQY